MSSRPSRWIPERRIRFAVGLAVVLAAAAALGTVGSRFALLLLLPAGGVGWTVFVMLRIRWQLSDDGGGWERRIHDVVLERLALEPDARGRVLDVGCGDASLLARLIERSPEVTATGIDLWDSSWDYAQAACESRLASAGMHATFRRMDAGHLELADGSFDAVVSVMCFHEVRAGAKNGPSAAVAEALRVLRPGGVFVFVDRFADRSDFGELALAEALRAATSVRRQSLVAMLRVPWPLRSQRALGPVEVISGRRGSP